MANLNPPDGVGGSIAELARALSETAATVLPTSGAVATLQRLVDLALGTIEDCDAAGVCLVEGDRVATPAQTGPVVSEMHDLQYRCGEGPCFDALDAANAIYADDLAVETRWPRFAPSAVSAGVRSLLAVRLPADDSNCALIVYAFYPKAFGILDRAKALILATFAGAALSSASAQAESGNARDELARRAENLQAALLTRGLIGQAQGILIEQERITPEAAFVILRRASQHLNVKLTVVAEALIATGEIPDKRPRAER